MRAHQSGAYYDREKHVMTASDPWTTMTEFTGWDTEEQENLGTRQQRDRRWPAAEHRCFPPVRGPAPHWSLTSPASLPRSPGHPPRKTQVGVLRELARNAGDERK